MSGEIPAIHPLTWNRSKAYFNAPTNEKLFLRPIKKTPAVLSVQLLSLRLLMKVPVFYSVIVGLLVCFFSFVNGQSTSTTQFANELKFVRPLAKRWSGELDFTNVWMASPPANGLVDKYSQWSLGGWGHNYIAKRWRVSAGLFYYHKIESAEPAQSKSNELRLGGQGIYYVKRIGYTATTRSRLEWRNIQNSEGNYNSVLRLRQQLKLIVPINSKSIRAKVIYGFTSDEVYLKTPSDVAGEEIFDRNRFEIGAGYAFTNDIIVELYYANEFLPGEINQINNIINIDLSFKNLISNVRNKYFPPPSSIPDE